MTQMPGSLKGLRVNRNMLVYQHRPLVLVVSVRMNLYREWFSMGEKLSVREGYGRRSTHEYRRSCMSNNCILSNKVLATY